VLPIILIFVVTVSWSDLILLLFEPAVELRPSGDKVVSSVTLDLPKYTSVGVHDVTVRRT
jgi:hypothetical protein